MEEDTNSVFLPSHAWNKTKGNRMKQENMGGKYEGKY
jgi:hypothetical protein